MKKTVNITLKISLILVSLLFLAACGGGSGSPPSSQTTYTIEVSPVDDSTSTYCNATPDNCGLTVTTSSSTVTKSVSWSSASTYSFTVTSDSVPTFTAAEPNVLTAVSCIVDKCTMSYEASTPAPTTYTIEVSPVDDSTSTYCNANSGNCGLSVTTSSSTVTKNVSWSSASTYSFTVTSYSTPTFSAAAHNTLTAVSCTADVCTMNYGVPTYKITVTAANEDTVTYCKNDSQNCPLDITSNGVTTEKLLNWDNQSTPLSFPASAIDEPTFTAGENQLTTNTCDSSTLTCSVTYNIPSAQMATITVVDDDAS